MTDPLVEVPSVAAPLPVATPLPVVEPVVIETITMSDIMNSREVIIKKEADDRAVLESIGAMGLDVLRAQLIQWASIGFPNAYVINEITINPPQTCSDGMVRNLASYIEYCSTKTIHQHIDALQSRLPDITVSFSYSGYSIRIVILKQ
jgi:hypothetical protein